MKSLVLLYDPNETFGSLLYARFHMLRRTKIHKMMPFCCKIQHSAKSRADGMNVGSS